MLSGIGVAIGIMVLMTTSALFYRSAMGGKKAAKKSRGGWKGIKPPTGNLQQDLLFVDVIGFNPKARLTHVFLHLVKLCAFPSFFPTSLCGVLVFGCALPSAPPPATLTHTTYSHTTLWHTTRSHKICSHTQNSLHTQLAHTQLSHTHLSHTHLSHTQLTHTQLTHIQLSHTHNSLTYNSRTHNSLTYNSLHTQLSSHTTLLTHNSLTHNSLTQNSLKHSVCQAWHLWPRAGSGGALGSRWRRSILCGRRSTWGHRPSFCVAGVALGDIDFHSVW